MPELPQGSRLGGTKPPLPSATGGLAMPNIHRLQMGGDKSLLLCQGGTHGNARSCSSRRCSSSPLYLGRSMAHAVSHVDSGGRVASCLARQGASPAQTAVSARRAGRMDTTCDLRHTALHCALLVDALNMVPPTLSEQTTPRGATVGKMCFRFPVLSHPATSPTARPPGEPGRALHHRAVDHDGGRTPSILNYRPGVAVTPQGT